MTHNLVIIAQFFGLSFIIFPSIAFIIGLWNTLSIKESFEYVKSSLVIPFIILLQLIISYSVIYVIFSLLDLPYL